MKKILKRISFTLISILLLISSLYIIGCKSQKENGTLLKSTSSEGIKTTEILGDGTERGYFYETQAFRVIDGDTINFIDEQGMLQGEWERLHPDGSFKCKGVYKDSRKDGYWERKFDNGNWRYQTNYKNGFLHGSCKWFYTSGNLKKEGNYKEGKEKGILKIYYENGRLQSEEEYKDGEINGYCKYYNKKNGLVREGAIINGKRDGNWKFYSEEGKLTTTVLYKEDLAVEIKTIKD
ncbi:MAG: toxin-antitoxin system YwqK family antitoxin [Bacteroidia bacterium]|nr:toxin-antitoxin system YwqK family antitoxin [Bacteroidia bacterium]